MDGSAGYARENEKSGGGVLNPTCYLPEGGALPIRQRFMNIQLAPLKTLSYTLCSWYILIMIVAFAPRLPAPLRRRCVAHVPYFANKTGSANIPIQCQLPEVSGIF
jgi:hypothetical protein